MTKHEYVMTNLIFSLANLQLLLPNFLCELHIFEDSNKLVFFFISIQISWFFFTLIFIYSKDLKKKHFGMMIPL